MDSYTRQLISNMAIATTELIFMSLIFINPICHQRKLLKHHLNSLCEVYNTHECKNCQYVELCTRTEINCFATWLNDSKQTVIEKGCWYGGNKCKQDECKAIHYHSVAMGVAQFFCCCKGGHCNNVTTYSENALLLSPDNYTAVNISCRRYGTRCRNYSSCSYTATCNPSSQYRIQASCYTEWRNDSNGISLIKMGCFHDYQSRCLSRDKCLAYSHKMTTDRTFFCCCGSDNCNEHYDLINPLESPKTLYRGNGTKEYSAVRLYIFTLAPVALTLIISVSVLFYIKYHYGCSRSQTLDVFSNSFKDFVNNIPKNLVLLELKSRGRFGVLWKASYNQKIIAAKIFSHENKESWLRERDIYCVTNFQHENILRFIAVNTGQEVSTNFCILTEFHDKGSIYDHLKSHTITWAELCGLGRSLTSGLAYLHTFTQSHHGQPGKPAIAHRDLKSKNILIKSDMTACIADFGLALKLDNISSLDRNQSQVGTIRYMAPEVLEGAIVYSCDSFLRIDMYACALVLWEMLSRCSAFTDVGEYFLPFEKEIGSQPTVVEMESLVVKQNFRPEIKSTWLVDKGARLLCETISECLDAESEGRLTAHCVRERMLQMNRADILLDHNAREISAPNLGNNFENFPSLQL